MLSGNQNFQSVKFSFIIWRETIDVLIHGQQTLGHNGAKSDSQTILDSLWYFQDVHK